MRHCGRSIRATFQTYPTSTSFVSQRAGTRQKTSSPLDAPPTFDDRDVPVDGKIRQALSARARRRPFDLDPVHFARRADPQHLTHVVRGEIAPAVRLIAASNDAAGRPGDRGADSIA